MLSTALRDERPGPAGYAVETRPRPGHHSRCAPAPLGLPLVSLQVDCPGVVADVRPLRPGLKERRAMELLKRRTEIWPPLAVNISTAGVTLSCTHIASVEDARMLRDALNEWLASRETPPE